MNRRKASEYHRQMHNDQANVGLIHCGRAFGRFAVKLGALDNEPVVILGCYTLSIREGCSCLDPSAMAHPLPLQWEFDQDDLHWLLDSSAAGVLVGYCSPALPLTRQATGTLGARVASGQFRNQTQSKRKGRLVNS